jgi:outer membrane translocation and assembly module TamA
LTPQSLTSAFGGSRRWRRNFKASKYAKGCPDATVEFSVLKRETNAANIQIDLSAHVKCGPPVSLGEVIFHGNQRTKTSRLESLVKLKEGEP